MARLSPWLSVTSGRDRETRLLALFLNRSVRHLHYTAALPVHRQSSDWRAVASQPILTTTHPVAPLEPAPRLSMPTKSVTPVGFWRHRSPDRVVSARERNLGRTRESNTAFESRTGHDSDWVSRDGTPVTRHLSTHHRPSDQYCAWLTEFGLSVLVATATTEFAEEREQRTKWCRVDARLAVL